MKILFSLLLYVILTTASLSPGDVGSDIPSNAKKIGPAPMREAGRTCYNYIIPGKRFTEDLLVAREIFEGNQLVERDLYQSGLDRNGIPESTLNGIQRKWHPNGQLASEEPYENGVMNGMFKQWNSRGQLVARYRMINGTGVRMVYNDSGALILDEEYHKGVLDGPGMNVSGPGNIMDIASYKDGVPSGIAVGFYPDGKIRSILWNGGPLMEYNESGAALDKIWQINGQRMSEKEYAQKAEGSSTLPPHFSDPGRYKLLVPRDVFDILNKYRVMPGVKIPLEFDKDGRPVPVS